MIAKALVAMEKSVLRLAAKDEQPDTVAAEYRKVAVELGNLLRKVSSEVAKQDLPVKK